MSTDRTPIEQEARLSPTDVEHIMQLVRDHIEDGSVRIILKGALEDLRLHNDGPLRPASEPVAKEPLTTARICHIVNQYTDGEAFPYAGDFDNAEHFLQFLHDNGYLSPKEVERSFSEQEMRAMLREISATVCKGPSDFGRSRAIGSIAVKYGITL